MKIIIAASHRFHLLELAGQLKKNGHDVYFYSYLPPKKLISYGLNNEEFKTYFYLLSPLLLLFKISKGNLFVIRLLHLFLDYLVSYSLKECDIFIGLGTVYYKSFIKAKNKYDAVTILEWGSMHIIDQQNILSKINSVKLLPSYFIKRTILSYNMVDYISVPSEHVIESFESHGFNKNKLIQNEYGVDEEIFKPTKLGDSQFDIICVGAWSYQKGSDLISKVCKKNNYSLLHVGSVVDVQFPNGNNFIHYDPVDESYLTKYYSMAKVFVLPSRQDGFGMVINQAIASGLPIVCSKNTGGPSISKYFTNKNWLFVMNDISIESLSEEISKALYFANNQKKEFYRDYLGESINNITWAGYGLRYHNNLLLIKN